MNWLDRAIASISPTAALKRAQARNVLAYYEGAKPSPQRKFRRDTSGPNKLVSLGAVDLRTQMRHLDRNHDITRGALDVLVNNTIGPAGIGVEFTPRRDDGSIHEEYKRALSAAYRDWCRRPEVTWRLSATGMQRLAARTLYRDGELFGQHILGPVRFLDHGTRVPYSLELLEPDFVPMDYSDSVAGINQGILLDAWGRTRGAYVYKSHPGEGATYADYKLIPSDRLLHVAHRERLHQVRGVTRFASVITRIEDIKDYEESERIAAKVAAMLTAYVKRNAPDGLGYEPTRDPVTGEVAQREIGLSPGAIIDTLAVGEEIGLIDSKRPNPNLVTFRNGQLRAFAAGIGASYSSISRNYDGTYSSQRQELVEQSIGYACLTDDFVSGFLRPVIESFIAAADLSGIAPRPRDAVLDTEDDVTYIAPAMPWIDPLKEATAWTTLIDAGLASEVEVMRKRGVEPEALLAQVKEWESRKSAAGVEFRADKALSAKTAQQANGTGDQQQ